MFPAKNNKNSVHSYNRYLKELNTGGIEMPISIKDITNFENQNDYIINVYSGNQDTNIQPRRISKIRDQDKKTINLLMLENGEKYHYVLISDFNRLLGSGKHMPKEFCPYCCHGFDKRYLKPGKMEEHMENCFTYGGCKVRMPEDGKNIIQFTQYNKQLMAPYTIYSIIKKEEEKQIHEISGFNISVVSPYEKNTVNFI